MELYTKQTEKQESVTKRLFHFSFFDFLHFLFRVWLCNQTKIKQTPSRGHSSQHKSQRLYRAARLFCYGWPQQLTAVGCVLGPAHQTVSCLGIEPDDAFGPGRRVTRLVHHIQARPLSCPSCLSSYIHTQDREGYIAAGLFSLLYTSNSSFWWCAAAAAG